MSEQTEEPGSAVPKIKRKGRLRMFAIYRFIACSTLAAVPVLAVAAQRNDFFECCTTRAYGFPLPWHIGWCLCGKSNLPVNPLYIFVNIGLILGFGWIASLFWLHAQNYIVKIVHRR